MIFDDNKTNKPNDKHDRPNDERNEILINNKHNNDHKHNHNDSTSPFMQLNLDKITNSFDSMKVSMKHQCYRLVHQDDDDDDCDDDLLLNSFDHYDDHNQNGDKNNLNKSSTPQMNGQHQQQQANQPKQQRRRRQLPKIPVDKKPFSKIWQMNIDNPTIDEQLAKNLVKNLRWKLTMANMLLEIKTDQMTGKTLSIKMINDDNDDVNDSFLNDDNNNNFIKNDNCDYQQNKENLNNNNHLNDNNCKNFSQSPITGTIMMSPSKMNDHDDDQITFDWCKHNDDGYDYDDDEFLMTSNVSDFNNKSSLNQNQDSKSNHSCNDSGILSIIDSPSSSSTTSSNTATAITNCIPSSLTTTKTVSSSSSFYDKIEFFETKSSIMNDNNDERSMDLNQQHDKMNEIKIDNENESTPTATHRALFKFNARHSDEIDLQIGDAIYLYEEFDDQWCDGLNLRTMKRGIFPSSLIIDVNYSEFMFDNDVLNFDPIDTNLNIQTNNESYPFIDFRIQRERFNLTFLGSIEVFKPKGEDVLDESIQRILIGVEKQQQLIENHLKLNDDATTMMNIPFNCLLEISDIGIRMIDNINNDKKNTINNDDDNNGNDDDNRPKHDYFFSLVQITYCGYQLKNENDYYFAFITRHPSMEQKRFACHVFKCIDHIVTKTIAESIAQAFHRFYNRFVQITLPIYNN